MNRKLLLYIVFGGLIVLSLSALAFSIENDTDEFYYDSVLWITSTQAQSEAETVTESKKNTEVKNNTDALLTEETAEFIYIDINKAGRDELIKLKGIGEKTADLIIGYRNAVGGFSDISEIMNIKGIGEKTFEGIKDHIYVTEEYLSKDSGEETDMTEEYKTEETMPPAAEFQDETVQQEETYIEMVNINTAAAEEFMQLPGIDRELAENIINLRTSIQYFQHIYELLYAEGMTKEKLSEIDEYLTL